MPHKMENAPGHPAQLKDFYPNVKAVYLPPNTTAFLQPMDLGVLLCSRPTTSEGQLLWHHRQQPFTSAASIATEPLPSTSAASTIPASPPSY